MPELCERYRINEDNLALRRSFIALTDRDVATLGKLSSWVQSSAEGIAHAFYEHQFEHPASRAFFERYATANDTSLAKLRVALESAQAGYLKQIIAEAEGGGGFGPAYFERRLFVGALHNTINLPLKWYLGSYMTYYDLIHASLRRRFPHRAMFRARAERALLAVFNLDSQAIVESFYYDTFSSMGLDLSTIEISDRAHDLSDHGDELKSKVGGVIGAAARASASLREAAIQIAQTTEEGGRAVGEIAHAMEDVAAGSERQTAMVGSLVRTVDDVAAAVNDSAVAAEHTAQAASEAREAARDGAQTAQQASEAMVKVRDNSEGAAAAIRTLAAKSEQIGQIVITIGGIAEQTNLLALNAAIEAARAGEQGKGFAVVAEEVRRLAESSHGASDEIASLIAEIQSETQRAVSIVESGAEGTEQGVLTVARASAAFETIGTAVDDIASRVDQIAAMSQEITASAATMKHDMEEVASLSEQASAATEQVSASTQQTSASTQETAASAAELAQTAEELSRTVASFASAA